MFTAWVVCLAAASAAQQEPASLPVAAMAAAPAHPVEPASPVALSAKFGHGLGFKTADGAFELKLRARAQVRFTHEEPGAGSSRSRRDEFIVRRARIELRGTFFHHFDFKLQLGLSPLDMEADNPNVLRDAQISFTRWRDLSLRVGQGKVQFDRQRMTSSSAIAFADRSIVMAELTLDRDVGAELFSDDLFGWGGRLSYALGVWGGDGRNRFAPNSALMYAARVVVSPFGGFDANKEGDPRRGRNFRLAIGLAGARNNATVRARSTTSSFYQLGGFSYWHATADLTLKWRGFFFLGEWLFRRADTGSRSGVVDGQPLTEYARSATGAFGQAGMMLTDHLELIARYGYLQPLGPAVPGLTTQHELGGGANWFFSDHDLKITVDYFFVADARWQGNHSIRVQTQLFF